MQTLLFQACLPTRQNGVENRDKAYLLVFIHSTGVWRLHFSVLYLTLDYHYREEGAGCTEAAK